MRGTAPQKGRMSTETFSCAQVSEYNFRSPFKSQRKGHMLIAAIAKLVLPSTIVEKVEKTLSKWDPDFPGTGNMENGAIWLDHIQCREESSYCEGFRYLDNVQIFRTWHYTTRVLNPQNIELKDIYKHYPLPKTGAEWALETVYRSLLEDCPYSLSPSSCATSASSSEPACRKGSPFSLNLHLRLLLHIFGDLHQPLHAVTLFARDFPDGDDGGNAIIVSHEEHPTTLHQLWDAGGGVFKKHFAEIDWSTIKEAALDIIAEYPKSVLMDRITGVLDGTNFAAIAEESARLAQNVAYQEFDWATFSAASLPYVPSDRYMKAVKEEARKQIAVGGYRLAHVITRIAADLPTEEAEQPEEDKQHQVEKNDQQKEKQQQQTDREASAEILHPPPAGSSHWLLNRWLQAHWTPSHSSLSSPPLGKMSAHDDADASAAHAEHARSLDTDLTGPSPSDSPSFLSALKRAFQSVGGSPKMLSSRSSASPSGGSFELRDVLSMDHEQKQENSPAQDPLRAADKKDDAAEKGEQNKGPSGTATDL
ncbi:uncharacterized protein LOC34622448 [Cyclospora cayetanensis]|uniref:Uncharacterized protein LOC34622448 n=1 Tax=Cyclospora cayetanensis TaxID=88456 RepID=A0A6P6RPW5_9EIME|nr:uncharacterized protein LOC34622448 [Cyclospora cayetanensis]